MNTAAEQRVPKWSPMPETHLTMEVKGDIPFLRPYRFFMQTTFRSTVTSRDI